jgi:CBS domain containing-hemolysin-like protein
MLQLISAVLIVLIASGLCSGSEAALFSIPIIRARQLAQTNRPAAVTLLKIQENLSRPIATIVVLNNIANIVGSIMVGRIAANVLGDQWLGAFSGALTFLVIMFSEIIPKTIGERYAEKISLLVARPVWVLAHLMSPFIWVIEQLTAPLTQGARRPITNENEIALLATLGRREGVIEEDESEMILQVFKLNDLTAEDLMTPRVSMSYLHKDVTLGEAKEQVIAVPHSRLIVIGDSIDDVVGVAYKDELLAAMVGGNYDQAVADFAHEAHFVPESVRADNLLREFQKTRQHLAVVVDEYGGVAGVVTLEDVLEVITGEIVDETDKVVDLQEHARKRAHLPVS